jgi:hypothetical protein
MYTKLTEANPKSLSPAQIHTDVEEYINILQLLPIDKTIAKTITSNCHNKKE